MRRCALLAAFLAAGLGVSVQAAPAASAAARADVMVVGKQRVLRDARAVRMVRRAVRVDGGRRCGVGGRTALGLLAGTRLRLRIRDYAACGRRTRDAGGLYVRQIGSERERGRGGWVYKIGSKAGTAAAGDLAGPFGRGGVRRGAQVLWFWCELGRSGCQRTLTVRPSRRRASPGQPISVRVVGHDDFGRGVRVAGASVRLGSGRATTDANGRAVIRMPRGAQRVRLTAAKAGLVRSFPVRVTRR